MKRRAGASGVLLGSRTSAILLLSLICLPGILCYDWRYENEGKRIVRSLGTHNNKAAKELSGVVASRKQVEERKGGEPTGVLWSHNDSGNGPYIFALNATTGEHIAWFELKGDNLPNHDWEDIAIGPGPQFGEDYLYVGDFGMRQSLNKIIRFPEPKLPYFHSTAVVRSFSADSDSEPAESHDPWELIPITKFEVIRFKYPSGKTHDCESMTIDPITGDIFIAAKHNNRLDVYVLHYNDIDLEGINEVKLHYSSCNDYRRTGTEECEVCNGCVDNIADYQTLTAADISPSGYGLIMSDYSHVFYWRRNFLNESFFESDPIQLPYQNRHGTEEALAWSWDSKGYFIVPEGSYPELRYYPYSGEAWWSQIRDYFGSCYAFIHLPTSSLTSIRSSNSAGGEQPREGEGEGPDAISDAFSSCIPVPCSEVSNQKQRAAANMVTFFEHKDECEVWQGFYDKMVNHGIDWLEENNKINYVEVSMHPEYSFIHDEISDLIEEQYTDLVSEAVSEAVSKKISSASEIVKLKP